MSNGDVGEIDAKTGYRGHRIPIYTEDNAIQYLIRQNQLRIIAAYPRHMLNAGDDIEQARAAYSIAMVQSASHRRVIGFGDRGVAVVSLLARNLDAARAWVGEVLGPLADDTEQAAMLRATLSTYFATGESHLHTAERMNLHRNTVKYRVGKALGDPTRAPATHDKLDVALALQACEYLGSSVLR